MSPVGRVELTRAACRSASTADSRRPAAWRGGAAVALGGRGLDEPRPDRRRVRRPATVGRRGPAAGRRSDLAAPRPPAAPAATPHRRPRSGTRADPVDPRAAADLRRAGPRGCRPDPGPRRREPRGTRLPRPRAVRPRDRRPRGVPRRRSPTAAARPSRAAGCGGPAARRRVAARPVRRSGAVGIGSGARTSRDVRGRRRRCRGRRRGRRRRPRSGPSRRRSPPPRACAASRRAQSWKVGQTGNALDRQYASWWASARGAGGDSAKQRWRWSGLVERPSRSSPNATNGQAGAPSMLGSPRSVIRPMIPGPSGRRTAVARVRKRVMLARARPTRASRGRIFRVLPDRASSGSSCPRVVIALGWWLTDPARWSTVFGRACCCPLLGFLFLPWTTSWSSLFWTTDWLQPARLDLHLLRVHGRHRDLRRRLLRQPRPGRVLLPPVLTRAPGGAQPLTSAPGP